MRVIAGKARSMPLAAPAGMNTRPTTDKIKETLFNMIQFDIPGAVFFDLYSGSGAIGIEALSRGAKHAYFVDNNKSAVDCIRKNVTFTKCMDDATIIARDVMDALYEIHDKADIVFMDPPYELGNEFEVMRMLAGSKLIDEDTIIIIEASVDRDLSDITKLGYKITKEKIYKSNKHVFFMYRGKENE
ncbi:MAG: 16S rRNA (guanine(966)-N(2))-methyltransferase RsmD [Lachnospiraceae bacterium]|nr:16S rRNA (guanine(966)-N(2))-methyltransferase RsmD [Candidatus Colinaster equi]